MSYGETQVEMSELFEVHMLNAVGKTKATMLAGEFNQLLRSIEAKCPEGRYLSIVRTKLEEACFYAKKAIATNRENQE